MRETQPQGCLGPILKLFGLTPGLSASTGTEALPYKRKDFLLSKAERSFYGVLQSAVGSKYLVFGKVRLADLLFIPGKTESRQSYMNKIQSKHIDFVLLDPQAIRPLLAIELDDSSHRRAKRQDRDAFVDAALESAGLPILRVPVQSAYNPQDLARSIDAAIET